MFRPDSEEGVLQHTKTTERRQNIVLLLMFWGLGESLIFFLDGKIMHATWAVYLTREFTYFFMIPSVFIFLCHWSKKLKKDGFIERKYCTVLFDMQSCIVSYKVVLLPRDHNGVKRYLITAFAI